MVDRKVLIHRKGLIMNRNKSIGRRVFRLLLVLLILLFFNIVFPGIFMPLPYRSLAPFPGKVIDADTKEPISGAAILAIYWMSAPSVGGEMDFIVDGQETVTDDKGEFKIPRKRRWLVPRRGYPKGELVIFRPGYGVFPKHKRSEAVDEDKSWPPPKKYVVYEIPKLMTKAERRLNLPSSFSEIPYKKKHNYIKNINKERRYLGLTTFYDEY